MTQVLYISYDGMTDPLGQSQVIPYLAGLSEHGFRFTLLSFEKKERFEKGAKVIQGLMDQYQINWIPLKYHKKPPILSTLYDIWKLRREAFILHKHSKFSIVHCRSYLASLIGLEMKNKFGVKFIFDMRGFWADERVEGGIWNFGNMMYRNIYRYFKQKETAFLEKADYTISLTQDGKNIIHSWKHIQNNPIPIKVIPCCADLDLFNRKNIDKHQVISIRKQLRIQDDHFILVYLGSLGTWYMLDEMLDFFKVLNEYIPEVCFLFITKDDPKKIHHSAQKRNIDISKLIIHPVERPNLPHYLALADLSIFFINPVFSKRASSPTKQGELMGMGIPIICNSGVGDTADIINKTRSGVIIEEFSVQAYNKICKDIRSHMTSNSNSIANGAQYFSLKNGIDTYLKIYQALLS